jgi:cobalamin biosynthetic protein CobC
VADLQSENGIHGGRLKAARALYPQVRGEWIDLSTGINPWGYPVSGLEVEDWARLPEPEDLAALERAAADYFGVDAACVVAVPGSDLAMRLLPGLLPDVRRMAIVGPTYGGHAAAWRARGFEAVDVPEDADGVTVVRPNNPDGRVIAVDGLRGVVIVDEAFADLTSGVGCFAPGRVVLRSFGKFFGLGGLRLGFVIADLTLAERLRGVIGAWPVSGPAVKIGTLAYRDGDWISATRERLRVAAGRLDEVIVGAGLEVVGGTSLFRLVRGDHAERLARRGILVRRFPGAMRIGLPADDAALARLGEGLKL